ncbi:MAG: hypothetical protein GF349_02165 [Candidatus Magasanikbacteria bacterium]|nr:hypothetical protein [Candidatus Magasanikbacteria bacterium]
MDRDNRKRKILVFLAAWINNSLRIEFYAEDSQWFSHWLLIPHGQRAESQPERFRAYSNDPFIPMIDDEMFESLVDDFSSDLEVVSLLGETYREIELLLILAGHGATIKFVPQGKVRKAHYQLTIYESTVVTLPCDEKGRMYIDVDTNDLLEKIVLEIKKSFGDEMKAA